MSIYTENGYENRREYLRELAQDYAVDLDRVLMMSDELGHDEDFDGLVSALEDIEFERDHRKQEFDVVVDYSRKLAILPVESGTWWLVEDLDNLVFDVVQELELCDGNYIKMSSHHTLQDAKQAWRNLDR